MKTFDEYIKRCSTLNEEDKPVDLKAALERKGRDRKDQRYTWDERMAIKAYYDSSKFKKGPIPVKVKEPPFKFSANANDRYKEHVTKKWHDRLREYGKYEILRGFMLDDWLFDRKSLFPTVCAKDLSDKMIEYVFNQMLSEKKPDKFLEYNVSFPREAMYLIAAKVK